MGYSAPVPMSRKASSRCAQSEDGSAIWTTPATRNPPSACARRNSREGAAVRARLALKRGNGAFERIVAHGSGQEGGVSPAERSFANAGVGDGNAGLGQPHPRADARRVEACFAASAASIKGRRISNGSASIRPSASSSLKALGFTSPDFTRGDDTVEPLGDRPRRKKAAKPFRIPWFGQDISHVKRMAACKQQGFLSGIARAARFLPENDMRHGSSP